MKVTKTTTTSQRTTAELDLFDDVEVPRELREEAAQAVGEYLVEQAQTSIAEGQSPIAGRGAFKPLSKEYKKHKISEGGTGKPDLEASGEMRDEISFRVTSKGIEFGVFGPSAPKADGHNNLSGESDLPTRRFIPAEGDSFKAGIEQGVKQILSDIVGEAQQFEKSDFEDVETKTQLYSELAQVFTGLSRSEIRSAVLRNDKLVRILSGLDLLELL